MPTSLKGLVVQQVVTRHLAHDVWHLHGLGTVASSASGITAAAAPAFTIGHCSGLSVQVKPASMAVGDAGAAQRATSGYAGASAISVVISDAGHPTKAWHGADRATRNSLGHTGTRAGVITGLVDQFDASLISGMAHFRKTPSQR
jgi:hypothetical protein